MFGKAEEKNTEGGDDGGVEPRICVAETSSVNDKKKEERKFDGNGRNRSWLVDRM